MRVRRLPFRRRLITSPFDPKRDIEPVPAVDADHRKRQVRELGFTELFARFAIHCVGNMAFGDQRHRLRPGQPRFFPVAIARRFPPRVEHRQFLFAFAQHAQILPVHI